MLAPVAPSDGLRAVPEKLGAAANTSRGIDPHIAIAAPTITLLLAMTMTSDRLAVAHIWLVEPRHAHARDRTHTFVYSSTREQAENTTDSPETRSFPSRTTMHYRPGIPVAISCIGIAGSSCTEQAPPPAEHHECGPARPIASGAIPIAPPAFTAAPISIDTATPRTELIGSIARRSPPPSDVHRVERGAILAEDFTAFDADRWREWQQDPESTTIDVRDGRLDLTANGPVGHDGLFGLTYTRLRDIVLVADMDIRSDGPVSHHAVLHLCGGGTPQGPDHWIEIVMADEGETVRFRVDAALPYELPGPVWDATVVLPHPAGHGFLGRITFDASRSEATLEVSDGMRWHTIGSPVAIPFRVVHTEVKMHRFRDLGDGRRPGRSAAWFDNVRIYPRPDRHAVGVRLVRPDGNPLTPEWPPRFRDPTTGEERGVGELVVQLLTGDGATVVTESQSDSFGFYLLPLRDAPWDVYPVSARIRVLLDGVALTDATIRHHESEGLYPDDLYDVVVRTP